MLSRVMPMLDYSSVKIVGVVTVMGNMILFPIILSVTNHVVEMVRNFVVGT